MKPLYLRLNGIQRRGGQVQLILNGHNFQPMFALVIINPNKRSVEKNPNKLQVNSEQNVDVTGNMSLWS